MTGFHDYTASRYETEGGGARVRVTETQRMHKFNEGYIPQRSYTLLEKPENQAIDIFEELGVALGLDRSDLLNLLADRDVENGICRCDDPEPNRTLAKGTPGERKFCGQCGGLIQESEGGSQ